VSSFIAADDLNDPHRRASSARRPAPHIPSDLEGTDGIRDHCQAKPKLMFSEHCNDLVSSDAGLERGCDAASPKRSLDRVDGKDRGTESAAKSIRELALPYGRKAAHNDEHRLIMPETTWTFGLDKPSTMRTPSAVRCASSGWPRVDVAHVRHSARTRRPLASRSREERQKSRDRANWKETRCQQPFSI
jgi:hypothetical protein